MDIILNMISRKEITRRFLDINKHIFSDTDINTKLNILTELCTYSSVRVPSTGNKDDKVESSKEDKMS